MTRDGSRAALASYANALVPRSLAEAAPGLATLLRYPRSYLQSDLVAGVTVGAVAVPSSLAMAELAAWALVRLLGAIPITPGGIGVIELGLTTALVAFGGNNAGAVAAVLVYRYLTTAPTLVYGLVAAATWRHHRPREIGPAGPLPSEP